VTVTGHICGESELVRQNIFQRILIPNFVKIRLTKYTMLEYIRQIVRFVIIVVFLDELEIELELELEWRVCSV